MLTKLNVLLVFCCVILTSFADVTRRKRADDVDLVALQTLVQQQASSIQQLQSQLTASTQQLQSQLTASTQQLQSELTASNQLLTTTRQELSTLKASLPSFAPVGFSVQFTADSQPGLALSPQAVLKFDHVITNLGNGYDPVTGIFTAPTAGLYTFYLSFMSVLGAGHTYIAIDKHGNALAYAFANGNDADFDRGAVEVTAHLAKGEQVYARQQSGPSVRGGGFTTFTGFLVQAD